MRWLAGDGETGGSHLPKRIGDEEGKGELQEGKESKRGILKDFGKRKGGAGELQSKVQKARAEAERGHENV